MKKLINSFRIGLILLAVAGLSSCEKKGADNSGVGTAEFSISVPDKVSQAKSGESSDSTTTSFQIIISVENMSGNAVFTDKLLPIYIFGTGYVSEKLEINAGEYKLTKFMVINPSGAVVYAAPLEGSPMAYLANRPLPLKFNIFPGKVTPVLPEVLIVGDKPPAEFGYASFGIQIIKPLDFYTYCVLGWDNPAIMAPIQMTNAKLTISNNNGWIYSFKLEPVVNHLVIRGGSENYTFLLEKEGYLPQKMQFTGKQLMEATKEKPLVLKIPLGSTQPQIMYFQPGPDAGKDAMISSLEPDKNFGGHKYFEATYMSEPLLTVMRSNRSLIFFDLSQLPKNAVIKKVVLKLSYDLPVPWDSTIFVSESNSALKPAGLLQQIIQPWAEDSITWNNQPKTTELNQVFIPPFVRNVNFIEVDVTKLFVQAATSIQPNHGMLFRLNADHRFKGFRFCSSDFPEAVLRPKLSVHFTI